MNKPQSAAQIIAAMFPNMSKSARALNSTVQNATKPPLKRSKTSAIAFLSENKGNTAERASFPVLRLIGQVRGGKNSMGVTKSGRHYARKPFATWRDDAIAQIRAQLPHDWQPIAHPVSIRLTYVAGDRRRRDMPAILDALFHALERAGFVKDDTLLWVAESSRSFDSSNPGVVIEVL